MFSRQRGGPEIKPEIRPFEAKWVEAVTRAGEG